MARRMLPHPSMDSREAAQRIGVRPGDSETRVREALQAALRGCHPILGLHGPERAERYRDLREARRVLLPRAPEPAAWPSAPPALRLPSPSRRLRGAAADRNVVLELDVLEMQRGCVRHVSAPRFERCPRCRGEGRRSSTDDCERCSGTGEVVAIPGPARILGTCPSCEGLGRREGPCCRRCRGAGRIARERSWSLTVPPGVRHGDKLRVPLAGDEALDGPSRGDLWVTILARRDGHFRLEGDDLRTEVEVGLEAAMFGTVLRIEGASGPIEVELPGGAQDGEALRVAGEGALRGDGRRGALLVTVRVRLPDPSADIEGARRAANVLDAMTAAAGPPPTGRGRTR